MMLAIAIFVLHSPAEVVSAPNLQYPCINHFRQCLQNEDIEVRLKCVQSLHTIFSNTERTVCTGYIHALAPRLMDWLHSKAAKQPSSDLELSLTLETIASLEALVHLAEPKHRIQMLKLLVPELIECLLEGPELKEANRYCRALHDQSLQWLMKIGPQFPQEFKALMSESSDMRSRLETAVRSNQEAQQKVRQTAAAKTNASAISVAAPPTIKLKTDFRNFSS